MSRFLTSSQADGDKLEVRPRYIRFIVTSSGSWRHTGRTRLPKVDDHELFGVVLASLGYACEVDRLEVHGGRVPFGERLSCIGLFFGPLVEQPKVRVVCTGTGLPARSASTAFLVSGDLTALTSPSSNRPT